MQILNYNINQKIGAAIRQLRQQKHKDGYPFMITDEEVLFDNQAYMEYADGHIEVVEFSKDYRNYTSIKTLTSQESVLFRAKFSLENA